MPVHFFQPTTFAQGQGVNPDNPGGALQLPWVKRADLTLGETHINEDE